MIYPDDRKLREEFVIRCTVDIDISLASRPNDIGFTERWLGGILSDILTPIGGLSALSRGPALDDILKSAAGQLFPGTVAGIILWYILRLEKSGCGGSVRKAIGLIQKMCEGAPIPQSRSEIYDNWSKYKSVSHFWSAFFVLRRQGWQFPPFDLPYDETLPFFLATVECFRLLGEKHYSPRQSTPKQPTLKPNETWKVPIDFSLLSYSIVAPIPSLSASEIKLLKSLSKTRKR
jgi:hypothetical protein